MKKGKIFLFCPAVSSTIFFAWWNVPVAQQNKMHSKRSCSGSRKSFTSQRNISYEKFHFLCMPLTLFFSRLIQTFFGGGFTRPDKQCAILCHPVFRHMIQCLEVLCFKMNCNEPLVSSIFESCTYFAVDDFALVGPFFPFCRSRGT